MLISIGNYFLCDGTRSGGVGVTRLRFRVDRKLQVAEVFRAQEIETFDRGNRKTTVTFEVSQTFDTLEDADIFVITREESIPSAGIVTLTATKPNGQKVARYLAGGKVQSHELLEQIGVTTRYQYIIVGGAIQSTPPNN